MKFVRLGIVLLSLIATAQSPKVASAQATAQERDKLTSIDASLDQIATLYRQKKYAQVQTKVAEVESALSEVTESSAGRLNAFLAPLQMRVAAARRLIDGRQKSGPMMASASSPTPKPGSPTPASDPNNLSFTRDVGPMLVGRCANCHIRATRGGFNMATFAALMKGSEGGAVVIPKEGAGSRLVEVLESGDMPRGGGAFSKDQISLISKWIDQGAKFDGPNDSTPLLDFIDNANAPAGQQRLDVAVATGKETVSFVGDLGPVLVDSCILCHAGMNPRGNLRVEDFRAFLRGGDGGAPLVPGKPSESLIVQKLRGMAGARMPAGRPPLDEEVIKKFETWISEGAKYDGGPPTQPLKTAVAEYFAKRMTHEELADKRSAITDQNWRLALPDEQPTRVENDDYILIGNLTPGQLNDVKSAADKALSEVKKQLKAPAGKPFIKGRFTVYAFAHRFDYAEFGSMVEQRQLPDESQGHYRFTIVDDYVAIYVPDSGAAETLVPRLAEQMAGAYLAAQGNLPEWYTAGIARNVAARIDPKNPIVKEWDDAVRPAAGLIRGADDILKTDATTQAMIALSYGVTRPMMPRFPALLDNVRKGAGFDQAFQRVYGADPKSAITSILKGGA